MLFHSWPELGRVVIVGILAYAALVLLLRISGKRTLTKLNAFDLVVTVALGSILATMLLNSAVSLSEGIVALAVLITLQFAITWFSVRSQRFRRLIAAEPTLLLHHGQFLDGALQAERMTREELLAAMRAGGAADVDEVAAVILETDGSISVLAKSAGEAEATTLSTVQRHPAS